MTQYELNRRVWSDPNYFIAFGFGSGLASFAPGTWGTLAAFPVYLIIYDWPWWLYLSFVVVAFIVGVLVSDKVTRDLNMRDYKGIVWDEVVGFLLTMFFVPMSWKSIVLGFFLFRLFDIWKPEPIASVDNKLHGGLGVMLDDAMAAVPACLILNVFAWGLFR